MNGKPIFKAMKKTLLTIFSLISFVAIGQTVQTEGDNLVLDKELKYIKTNPDFGKITVLDDSLKAASIFEFETLTQPKFIYKCATAIPIKKNDYKKGRVFLVSFEAKTIKSSLETGEAKLNILFRQTASYKDNLVSTQSISSNWQTYFIPIQSTVNLSKEEFRLVFHYGFKPQSFQVKNLKFEVFPEGTDISSLPKTLITYKGMEVDANWRKSAEARIEKIRKSDFQLQILKKGKPIANKTLSIELVEHDFPFGAAVEAKQIVDNTKYYNKFKKAFNHVVLANALKIKAWRWEQKRPITLKALDMLNDDGYSVKGHVLIWPGFNYLTPVFKEKKDNPEAIIKLMADHVNTILEVTKGKVMLWDVVNEAYTNQDLQTITGSEEILYDGFRTLKAKQPNVLAYTNEYGIISKGGLDSNKQQWYYDFVKRIDENTNGQIDGIGIQCHIGSDLTPPERVLKLLNFYATLGKKISISEFTMDIQEPEIREQYTKDFMIAAFSHPNVSEFLFWGFVEDERKKVDIYKKDWTIGAMGKAYFSLVHDTWKTNLVAETNDQGTVNGRGFYGTYKYTFVEDGKVVSGTFRLKPNQTQVFKVQL